MSKDQNAQDPLEFVRGMWNQMGFSLPGMVTPTLDVDELDKRIKDMRAVEGWLKMNLNMLQMSIQGLEMQRAALAAVKAMSQQAQQAGEGASDSASNPFASAAAMWPWNLMNNVPGSDDQPAASDTESNRLSSRIRAVTCPAGAPGASRAAPLKLSGSLSGQASWLAASSMFSSAMRAAGAPVCAVEASLKSSAPPCTASRSMASCQAAGGAAGAAAAAADEASDWPEALA